MKRRDDLVAIEVKSGNVKGLGGLDAFKRLFPTARTLVVGSGATPLESFLHGTLPLFG